MCLDKKFYTRWGAENWISNPKIAHKDIEVYKVVHIKRDGTLVSAIMENFEWKKGETHTVPEIKIEKGKWINGVVINLKKQKFPEWYEPKWYVSIYNGFHAYIKKTDAKKDCIGTYEKVITLIIPKGTLYYRSRKQKQIVTSKLIFK